MKMMTKLKKLIFAPWRWFAKIGFFKKILVILLVAALAFVAYKIAFKVPDAPLYKTVKLKKGDIVDIVEASGPIAPITTTQVGALVSGEILKIYVDYNTVVKKGDLMAIVDPTQIQANYDQAEASLSSAKEELESAKMTFNLAAANLKRYKALYAKDYVAKTDLEQYELAYSNGKSGLNSAESRVIQAQASLDKVKKDLDNTKIISPIDGVVLSKAVSEGQSLTSGFSTPELFTVAQDLTKMQIEAKVSEADVVKIKDGQVADFTLDGYPGENFTGIVRQVRTNYVASSTGSSSSASSSNSTSYTVVIDVDNAELKLMPGMTATITIRTKDKKDVLVVPNEALRFSPASNEEKFDKTGIWLLGPDNQPYRVDVTIGIIATKKTEIVSGDVKEGEAVIVSEKKAGSTASTAASHPPMGGGRRR